MTQSEFKKYRVVQDRLFESDFDKFLLDMKKKIVSNKGIKKVKYIIN